MKHRFGHQVLWTIFYAAVRLFVRPAIGFHYRRAKRIKGPAIIMCNHCMDIDVGLLGMSYAQCMRVVASEHVFRKGIITFLIWLFFDPIVRMKGKTEIRTVREMLGAVKKGGRVCIFPEGNRSYNGLTGEITKASATLAKMAKCQLITYRIEGGYLRFPRWARKARRGPTFGCEVGRYPAEQLQQMSVDEIYELIKRDMFEDAYARQRENPAHYTGENLAESIETALYLCPKCGGVSTIRSEGDRFSCPCGLSMRYTDMGMLESETDEPARFATVTDWDLWQQGLTAELAARAEDSITQDEGISLYRISPCEGKRLAETGTLSINNAALTCGSVRFALEDISDLAIIDLNTLVFEISSGDYFEIRSEGAYSALKYRRLFLYCKKNAKGECDTKNGVAQS